MNKTLFFLCVCLCLGLCSACRTEPVFQQYKALAGESWDKYEPVELTAHIPDSGSYRVRLCVRYTIDYPFANLWCIVSSRSTQTEELHDTLNLVTANAEGRWQGQGQKLKTLETELNHTPVRLPQGDVVFRIRHGMPQQELEGVKDVGIEIYK